MEFDGFVLHSHTLSLDLSWLVPKKRASPRGLWCILLIPNKWRVDLGSVTPRTNHQNHQQGCLVATAHLYPPCLHLSQCCSLGNALRILRCGVTLNFAVKTTVEIERAIHAALAISCSYVPFFNKLKPYKHTSCARNCPHKRTVHQFNILPNPIKSH